MTISSMTSADIPTLARIEKECFFTPWSERAFESELTNEAALFLVARAGGEIAGYAGSHLTAGECYITNVAVSKRFRRQGVARALLSELCRVLRGENAQFVTLEVRPSNTAAVSLYESFGFQRVGAIKNMYENPVEDAFVYTLYFSGETS